MKYIFSDKYKFVYFVIPKVACTSIKTAFVPIFDFDTNGYWETGPSGKNYLRVHKLYDDSSFQINRKQLDKIWPEKLCSYFSFAFVRNPWDRLVSCWLNKVNNPKNDANQLNTNAIVEFLGKANVFYNDMGFDDFVRHVAMIPDDIADIHFRSQFTIIQSNKQSNKILPEFIGKFENLSESFNFVTRRLGIENINNIPHRMKSRQRDGNAYHDYYTTALKNLVLERYARDIDEFSYRF